MGSYKKERAFYVPDYTLSRDFPWKLTIATQKTGFSRKKPR
jgi:hypothetical protein